MIINNLNSTKIMKNFAIVVFREDGSKFVRSYHKSAACASRIVNGLNRCPHLLLRTYKVYDLVNRCYC